MFVKTNRNGCLTWMVLLLLTCLAGGCQTDPGGPVVIFLDGAGWYTGDRGVRKGMREAGFDGAVQRFEWSTLLGPVADHVSAGKYHPRVPALAERITELRRAQPDRHMVLMGLSAGTSLIISALEVLPEDVEVDHVALLQPSVSAGRDLTDALSNVKGRLYATVSRRDELLAAAPSAALESGRPAGRVGFSAPLAAGQVQYRKVVNIYWNPTYSDLGWDGGHISVTSARFIREVIAPRVMQRVRGQDLPPVGQRTGEAIVDADGAAEEDTDTDHAGQGQLGPDGRRRGEADDIAARPRHGRAGRDGPARRERTTAREEPADAPREQAAAAGRRADAGGEDSEAPRERSDARRDQIDAPDARAGDGKPAAPDGWAAVVRVSRDDDRYPTRANLADGLAVEVDDTDDDPLEADLNIYRLGGRLVELEELPERAVIRVADRHGRDRILVVIDIYDEDETVTVGLRPVGRESSDRTVGRP